MKLYRFEWYLKTDTGFSDDWGTDYIEAPNFRTVRKTLKQMYESEGYIITEIDEVKHLKKI